MGENKNNFGIIIAKYILLFYLVVALLSPILIGDKQLICSSDDGITFPFISNAYSKDTAKLSKKWCIEPLIPYAPGTMDASAQQGVKPFYRTEEKSLGYTHWLGTDKLGRDVLAGIISGTVTALQIGFFSVFLAFLIGVTLGMSAAYFKDDKWILNLAQWFFGIIGISISLFYLWYENLVFHKDVFRFLAYFMMVILFVYLINKQVFSKFNLRKIAVPLDTIVMKMIEVRKSIPGLFLLLSLIVLFPKPSIWNIILVISILMWSEFARFARAETLAVREETYIQSVKVLGFDSFRILFIHILPNILPTMLVLICFNISSAIILESSLSFLGIGLPVEEVSWGKLLAEGRNMKLWWLVVFPGLAIFIVVLCLNIMATHLQNIGPKRN